MRIRFSMALLMVFVDCIVISCAHEQPFSPPIKLSLESEEAPRPKVQKAPKAAKKNFAKRLEVSIPINTPKGQVELLADIFRPEKAKEPKTIVIMVPGSGNVSRRGEITGDGIITYPQGLELSSLWAESLAEQGFYVLSYDKRSCTAQNNPLCNSLDQSDISQDGIGALAKDLDQVFAYAQSNVKADHNARIVFLSTTQGAQVITLAEARSLVSGIALLSPIFGDLGTMWVNGLSSASNLAKSQGEKNRLLNQKESLAAFFTSLKRKDFPETALIRGTSVKFWQSWIEASMKTLPELIKNSRPALLLFSSQDPFNPASTLRPLHDQGRKSPHLSIKVSSGDRNFIEGQSLSNTAIKEVAAFINGL